MPASPVAKSLCAECGADEGEAHAETCSQETSAPEPQNPDSTDPGDAVRNLKPKRKMPPKRHGIKGEEGREMNVSWIATVTDSDLTEQPNALAKGWAKARTIRLKGTYIDTSVNLNKWAVPADELANIADQLSSGLVQVRIDHSESVRDVIGVYTKGTMYDADNAPVDPADARSGDAEPQRVDFEARITIEDSNLAIPILMGYVSGVSPNLVAEVVDCGVCGKTAYPEPTCAHFEGIDSPGYLLLRNCRVKEGSIVATPAYQERTPFIPTGFAAAVDQKTKDVRRMAGKDEPNNAAANAGTTDAVAASFVANYHKATKENDELRAKLAAAEKANSTFEARLAKLEVRAAKKAGPSGGGGTMADESDDADTDDTTAGKKKARKADDAEESDDATADEDNSTAEEAEEAEDADDAGSKKKSKKASEADRRRAIASGGRTQGKPQGTTKLASTLPGFGYTPPEDFAALGIRSGGHVEVERRASVEMLEAFQGKRPKNSYDLAGRYG